MTFFNWIPEESNEMISPWVAIYFGVTIVSTVATLWRFQEWAKKQEKNGGSAESYYVAAEFFKGLVPTKLKPVGTEAV